jgi:hypothetical protein
VSGHVRVEAAFKTMFIIMCCTGRVSGSLEGVIGRGKVLPRCVGKTSGKRQGCVGAGWQQRQSVLRAYPWRVGRISGVRLGLSVDRVALFGHSVRLELVGRLRRACDVCARRGREGYGIFGAKNKLCSALAFLRENVRYLLVFFWLGLLKRRAMKATCTHEVSL